MCHWVNIFLRRCSKDPKTGGGLAFVTMETTMAAPVTVAYEVLYKY